MKTIPPLECFPVIHAAMTDNRQILTDTIQVLHTICSKFDALVASISAIDISLPVHRQKQGMFSRLTGQLDFPNTEPNFTQAWTHTFSSGAALPHSGHVLRGGCLPHLSTIHESYQSKVADLESRWKRQLDLLDVSREQFQTTYTAYRKHCEAIEIAHTKSATNPEIIPDFASLKASLKACQEPVVAAWREFSDAVQDAHLAVEGFMAEFEEIDQGRYEAVEQILKDLGIQLSELTPKYQKYVSDLEAEVQGVSSATEVSESFQLEPIPDSPVKISVALPVFDFDITSLPFLKTRELFQEQLIKYRGKVTRAVKGFTDQEVVTVVRKSGKKLTVEKASGETAVLLEEAVEKLFERRLAKLNAPFEKLREGETVVIIEEPEPATCIVLNVFRETFAVPAAQLTPV
jgi:hypothetical protein